VFGKLLAQHFESLAAGRLHTLSAAQQP